MPDFRNDCPARMPSLTHEHCCFLAKDHGGRHACYCGMWWDETGGIKLRQPARRR